MTYLKDLSDYPQGRFDGAATIGWLGLKPEGSLSPPRTKCVGWLASGYPFPTEIPSEELLDLLWDYCAISVNQTRGMHRCDFCPATKKYWREQPVRSGKRKHLGSAEIRVFSKDGSIYAAPTLIYHYVSAHHYKPPDEFVRAMQQGPKPTAPEFFVELDKLCLEWNKHSLPESIMIQFSDITEAQSRLRGITTRTHLIEFEPADDDRRLFLKPENHQPIGAFKLRGAYNKIASLSEPERKKGVISYSSGNHAQGVAYAARALKTKAVIVMPNNAPQIKREATAKLGAEIVLVGPGSDERKIKAEELAAQHGYVIVPPYNDEKIIAGQGTIGLEILEDLPEVDTILSPVGGGGLISGVAAAIKLTNPKVKVIGVEPELAADAQASLRAGKIAQFPAEQVSRTLADGLRTQSIGELNFEHIRRYVDDIITVTEEEIREAMRLLAQNPQTVAEPSGAVATAGFLFHRNQLPNTKLNVAIISGGNIEPAMLAEIRADAHR